MISDVPPAFREGHCALMVGHPGHELRVHGWLERFRPDVSVITDGSGSRSPSRLDSTTRVLARAAARPGAIYGAMSDRQLYDALLAGDAAPFLHIASTLCAAMMTAHIEVVASDSPEGFNPTHDLCFHLVGAAVERAALEGRQIHHYAFDLDARPDRAAGGNDDRLVRIRLSDEQLARKLDAARGYVGLDRDVGNALSRYGEEAFRTELLWPAALAAPFEAEPPAYERFGQDRLETGVYETVIRRRRHVDPIVASLHAFASAHV